MASALVLLSINLPILSPIDRRSVVARVLITHRPLDTLAAITIILELLVLGGHLGDDAIIDDPVRGPIWMRLAEVAKEPIIHSPAKDRPFAVRPRYLDLAHLVLPHLI